MFRLSLTKLIVVIVVAIVVIALVVSAPSEEGDCNGICAKVEYTCTGKTRTSLYAEVRNGTSEVKTLTVVQNNGEIEASATFPLTQRGTPKSGYRLDKPVQQEFPYTFRFEIDGKVITSGEIKPGDPCKPEDVRK